MKATAPRKAAPDTGQFDLEIAISKARAAGILLRADADYLQIPVYLNRGETEQDIRAWIKGFSFEALDAALEEAKAARRKLMGRKLDFAAGPGRKAVD